MQTSLFRVPQLLERLMPFCVLVAAMSCYLNLSRRLELVVARSAGVSAWQFLTPALVSALVMGVLATTIYNPVSASLQEQAQQNEMQLFGDRTQMLQDAHGFWLNQATSEGQTIINAASSQRRGELLSRTERLPIRSVRPIQRADRGARGDAGRRLLAVQERAPSHLHRAGSGRGQLSTARPA